MVRRRARPGLTRAAGILAVLVAGAPDAPVIGPSGRLAVDIRNAYHRITGEPYSDYVGTRGFDVRTDLGGLNLSIPCPRSSSSAATCATPPARPGWPARGPGAHRSGPGGRIHRLPQQEFLSMFSAIAKVRAIIYCCDTREVLRPGRWAPGTALRLRVQTSGPGPACPGTGPGPDTRNSRPAGPDCRRDGGESELCGSR
jgi:hypothetical protein